MFDVEYLGPGLSLPCIWAGFVFFVLWLCFVVLFCRLSLILVCSLVLPKVRKTVGRISTRTVGSLLSREIRGKKN